MHLPFLQCFVVCSHYGRWPDILASGEDLGKLLTKEHRQLIMDKCSNEETPKMPNVPTSPSLMAGTAGENSVDDEDDSIGGDGNESSTDNGRVVTPPLRRHENAAAPSDGNGDAQSTRTRTRTRKSDATNTADGKTKKQRRPGNDAVSAATSTTGRHQNVAVQSDGNGGDQSVQKRKSDATANTSSGEPKKQRMENDSVDTDGLPDWIDQMSDIARKQEQTHNSRLKAQVDATNDLQKALDLEKSSNAEKDAQIKLLTEQLDAEREEKAELDKKMAEQSNPKKELDAERNATAQLEEENKRLQQKLATETQNHQQLKETLLSLGGTWKAGTPRSMGSGGERKKRKKWRR